MSMSKKELVQKLIDVSDKLAAKSRGTDSDYAKLQLTWNKDILERSYDYLPYESGRAIGIGSFMGALEIALASKYKTVTCVDHKSYLPFWKPKNVKFYKADIDSNDWKMPSLKNGERYDVCYFIETIEHLLWSPLPLLNWIKQNVHCFVISTPDDLEWPEMEIHPWTRYQHFSDIPAASPGVKGNPLPMFHTKQYNQAEFVEILDYVGFRVNEFFRTGEGKHQMVAICQPR